jgi:hypothetical protein
MKSLIFATFTVLALSLTAFTQAKSNNKIDSIQAFLIYEENGKLSQNILDGKFTFWNTVIGEGDAEGHSSATLVEVIISTDGKTDKTFPVLQFSAISEDGKRINYTKTVDYFFPKEGASKVYVPFLLHDTGCEKIKLIVKLVNSKNKPTITYQTVTKVIPFVCGE